MQLRPYQQRAVEMLRQRWRERPILMMPTGSGKTCVVAEVIRDATAEGKRSLFIVHRRELLLQGVERLQAWGVEAGIIAAGVRPRESLAQVASVQTLARRAQLPPADVVCFDECHHCLADQTHRIADHYRDAFVFGVSATPYRLDGRGLGALFGCIIEPVTVRQLCDQGVLVEPRVLAPHGPNLTGVRRRAGDYDLAQLGERMDRLTGDVVAHWFKHARGMRTVGFAVNVAHSRALAERFTAAGARAAHVDGSMTRGERDGVLAALRDGALDILWNCNLLGEGWDLATLQCAVVARPTASLGLHRQILGRIVRSAPGKEGALVLDHAGNTGRHGFVTDEVEVSLHDRARRVLSEAELRSQSAQFQREEAHARAIEERERRLGELLKEKPGQLVAVNSVAVNGVTKPRYLEREGRAHYFVRLLR